MFKKNWSLLAAALVAAFVFVPSPARAQATDKPTIQAPDIPVEEIIRKFAEKEKEFKAARDNYVYRQEVKVQEFTGSRVTGEYQALTDISFDDKGRRTERVIRAPAPTLKQIVMTKEDFEIIESIQPFVLTTDEVNLYNLKYGGKEKLDEISCYVFDVSPKKIEKDRQYFEGKIWVDDQDFQIVKTLGKPVPDRRSKDGGENLFGKFETYREQIDGVYWFPTYTRVEDTLQFERGPVKIREIIRYTDYRKFQTSVKLRFGGEVADEKDGAKSSTDSNLAPALDPKLKNDPKTQQNQKK
jgi:hypothetical protein